MPVDFVKFNDVLDAMENSKAKARKAEEALNKADKARAAFCALSNDAMTIEAAEYTNLKIADAEYKTIERESYAARAYCDTLKHHYAQHIVNRLFAYIATEYKMDGVPLRYKKFKNAVKQFEQIMAAHGEIASFHVPSGRFDSVIVYIADDICQSRVEIHMPYDFYDSSIGEMAFSDYAAMEYTENNEDACKVNLDDVMTLCNSIEDDKRKLQDIIDAAYKSMSDMNEKYGNIARRFSGFNPYNINVENRW